MKILAPAYLIPAVAVALLGLIVAMWFLHIPSSAWPQSPPSPTPTPVTGSITVEGEMICLPHKDQSGPQTLECAYGLKSDAGDYYGLRDLNQDQMISGQIATGQRYQVVGESTAPAADDRYAVIGNISVTTISTL